MTKLPEKTVERLSSYRRTLLNCLLQGKTHIFSYELATLHNITAVQVRRDIMFIGYSSAQKKGYDVRKLIDVIEHILDSNTGINVAVIGMGNLGKAITGYFIGKRPKLRIVASFDIDQGKVNTVISGIRCYPISELATVIRDLHISIALLTVPPEMTKEIADKMVQAGIKGILNFTSVPLNPGPGVYIEEYDMITSIEKVAYFIKKSE
jgi:redox-sensing transcriptional repressor